MIVGELSLDGAINGIRGVLPIAVGARRLGLKRLLLPPQNAAEASVVEGLDICVAQSLAEAVEALNRARTRQARASPAAGHLLTPILPTAIWQTFAGSSSLDARSKSPPPAVTTC